jgi:hypothetical protein
MKISERQVMLLIEIAKDYSQKIRLMISKDMTSGDPERLMKSIDDLLTIIENQQSNVLINIED